MVINVRGWAARFSTVDNQGDVILPGAFDDSLRREFRTR